MLFIHHLCAGSPHYKPYCLKKWLPVVKTTYRDLGNDGVAVKMLQRSILSDSPSSYAAKAG